MKIKKFINFIELFFTRGLTRECIEYFTITSIVVLLKNEYETDNAFYNMYK